MIVWRAGRHPKTTTDNASSIEGSSQSPGSDASRAEAAACLLGKASSLPEGSVLRSDENSTDAPETQRRPRDDGNAATNEKKSDGGTCIPSASDVSNSQSDAEAGAAAALDTAQTAGGHNRALQATQNKMPSTRMDTGVGLAEELLRQVVHKLSTEEQSTPRPSNTTNRSSVK